MEVCLVISAEVEPRSFPCPRGRGGEEIFFENPVLVVSHLRPRIRKEHPDFLKSDAGGQRMKKLPRLRAHEVTVGEPRTVAFFAAALESIENHVDADTEFLRKFLRVAHQKVPVAASHFPDNRLRCRKQRGERRAESRTALGNFDKEGGLEIHRANSSRSTHHGKPEDAPRHHWRAGVTGRVKYRHLGLG